MSNTYAVTEIVGSSEASIDDAIRDGIRTAGKSLRHLEWFQVGEIRGHIEGNEVAHFQVVMKVGLRYED